MIVSFQYYMITLKVTKPFENQDKRHSFQRTLNLIIEPRHDKNNKVTVHQAKTQISLGIRPV